MKINATIDLHDILGWDGNTLATQIADELRDEIKRQVRKQIKEDPSVDALIRQLKNAAVEKMMADFSNAP